ncbi:hypothetical protein HCH52_06310 [Oscillospiraceae bacterium HV4-5-C5C]|nr:hypothetical protein [Oscillospiraceae bacterium HV4-5-C5C]
MSREADIKRPGKPASDRTGGLESLADIMRLLREELTAVKDPLFPELDLPPELQEAAGAASVNPAADSAAAGAAGAADQPDWPLMTGRALMAQAAGTVRSPQPELIPQPSGPRREPEPAATVLGTGPQAGPTPGLLPEQDPFAELLLPAQPGVNGRTANHPPAARVQPLLPPDPVQTRLAAMRRLARTPEQKALHPARWPQWYDDLFYRQALFMADFELAEPLAMNGLQRPFLPHYQAMTEQQLRTYFSWRSLLRQGKAAPASLPVLYLYSNELLNMAGTAGPEDSFRRLLDLWQAYRQALPAVDPVFSSWVKDFYITHEFKPAFDSFQTAAAPWPDLLSYYNNEDGRLCSFARLAEYSDYKISRSAFYNPDNARLMADCFDSLCVRLDQRLQASGTGLAALLYYQTDEYWEPFAQARCHPSTWRQDDCWLQYSEAESYYQVKQRWHKAAYKALLPAGRGLIGYLLKQIEIYYRTQAGFKHHLKPPAKDPGLLDLTCVSGRPTDCRLSPEQFFTWIDQEIADYYQQTHRIQIEVRHDQLQVIRLNAQRIQDRLLADLGEAGGASAPEPTATVPEPAASAPEPAATAPEPTAGATSEPWARLLSLLDATAQAALRLALERPTQAAFQTWCHSTGCLPEVLIDRINEAALDSLQDSLLELDDQLYCYEDYEAELRRALAEAGAADAITQER